MTIIGLFIAALGVVYIVYACRPRIDGSKVDAEVERQLAELEARGIVPTGDVWKELGK